MENIPLLLFGAGYFIIGLGIPAGLVVGQLVLAWPALRETRPIDSGRRTGAGVLAMMSLLSVVPFVPAALSGKVIPLVLVGVLAGVSAFTLIQLYRTNPAPRTERPRGT
ncbi:hypothetical protein [uncultured Kocuria sp.]|uniref:hypothetical protein n=1 Tax=uncultured Kocuria sp. TaxID=259305 RepID=UPI00261214ED|nr:hypothetical protein [uncultured Kocuria sp.]